MKKNKLTEEYPQIANEWNVKKNRNLDIADMTIGSTRKVWWKCSKGHEWPARIDQRCYNLTRCPYCAGKKTIVGETDLATVNPELSKEWHPNKNGELTTKDVTDGSHKKTWWTCKNGHEWKATIGGRNRGHGCPYCAGQKVMKGYNDLETINSKVATEWHPNKNGALKPYNFTANSGKKVWWKCKEDHEWMAVIGDRNNGHSCPYCVGKKAIVGETDLATVKPELSKEWHPNKNGELTPQDVTAGSSKKVWWQCKNGHEWDANIASRTKGTECPHCKGMRAIVGETDLATINPKLAYEWHPYKNGELTPQNVTSGSEKRVWWRCENGHEWETTISNRCKGNGCPYCSGRKAIKGETDLATMNSELAKEWHPKKNNDLKPEDVTIGSGRRVWWQCGKGHEWKTTIVNRKKCGCPYCSGRYVIKGENDLLTINPKLATEWHSLKNAPLTVQDISCNCNRKVWWQCKAGHEWKAVVGSRNRGIGCPYCAGKKAIVGETDLATVNLELSKEWHPNKNGELTPQDVTGGSSKKVWWKCKKGHEWKSTVANRTNGNNCSYCAGQKVISGVTDLGTMNSELAKEWHKMRNGNLSPLDVTVSSTRKAWWQCSEGHEWRAVVANRNKGTGCPYCARQKLI